MSSPMKGSIATKIDKKIERMTIPEKDKIDVVCRTLQNVSKDIPNYMILRESLQNEIDSVVMRGDNKDSILCSTATSFNNWSFKEISINARVSELNQQPMEE